MRDGCRPVGPIDPEPQEPTRTVRRNRAAPVEHPLVVHEERVAGSKAQYDRAGGSLAEQAAPEVFQHRFVVGQGVGRLEPGRAKQQFAHGGGSKDRESQRGRSTRQRGAPQLDAPQTISKPRRETLNDRPRVHQKGCTINVVLSVAIPRDDFNCGVIGMKGNPSRLRHIGMGTGTKCDDLFAHDPAKTLRQVAILRRVANAGQQRESPRIQVCTYSRGVSRGHSSSLLEHACQHRPEQSCQQSVITASFSHRPSSRYGSPYSSSHQRAVCSKTR